MYCQAHASDSEYSRWYYPPVTGGKTPQFSWYGTSTTHPVVYSAAESHASYTTPGQHDIGVADWKGQDVTDQGALWNETPNVQLVSVPGTYWLQFSGRWGATVGITGRSPDPPAAQGWLIPRSDGPVGDKP